MTFPLIARAVVMAQAPDNYGLVVAVLGGLGGQAPTLPVSVLTHGPRDAVRCDLAELPTVGTHGIVCFPSGDGRNGHWLGASEPALVDASPGQPGTTHPRYAAYYAGGYSGHMPDGTTFEVLADGSVFLSGNALPALTRHTVDQNQVRQRTPYTTAERNPNPPGPYPASFSHKSGASVAFTAAGAVSASAAAGQTLTLSANGATVTIGAAGQVTVDAASGEPLTLACAGATITFDGSGDVTVASAGGAAIAVAGALVTVSTGGATQAVRLVGGGASVVLMAE